MDIITISLILSIIGYIWIKQDGRIEKCEANEKDIKENYIDRFEINSQDHTDIKIMLARLETKLDTIINK